MLKDLSAEVLLGKGKGKHLLGKPLAEKIFNSRSKVQVAEVDEEEEKEE